MIGKIGLNTIRHQKGVSQIPLMLGLLIMALAVPVAAKLAQKNQENRGMASGGYDDCVKQCSSYGNSVAAVNCVDSCYGKYPTSTSAPKSKTDCSVCDGLNNGTAKITCYENCGKLNASPTKSSGGGGSTSGGSSSGSSNSSSGGSTTSSKNTSSSSKCTSSSTPPADKCSSSLLQINAQCNSSNKWDYDDQTCNAAGRVEVCGGKQYCCPSKGGKWTTTLTKCPNACLECPKDFVCYQNDDDYKWFVSGYVPEGYVKVASSKCTAKKISKPTFKGKLKGDANCDGLIDKEDLAVWKDEYVNGKDGEKWQADFTGKNGKCDGLVNGYDYSLWRRQSIDLGGK